MMNNYGQQYQNNAFAQPQALMNNPLNPEEKKAMEQSEDVFNLKVTPKDLGEGICAHHNPETHTFSTVVNQDGTLTCTQCHQTFNPDIVTPEYVQSAVDAVINVLQTCKWLGVDLPNDTIRQYFSMIPYIKKIPLLYKMVTASYNNYMQRTNPNMAQAQPSYFNALNWIMSPGSMPQAQPFQQPQGGYPFYQQPYNTPYQQQQSAMVNGGTPFYQQPPQNMPQAQPVTPPVQPVDPTTQPQPTPDVTVNKQTLTL